MSQNVAAAEEISEEDRVAVLRGLGVLDSDSDPQFDRIARLAAALFDAPRSSVILVDKDRLWHKASVGLPSRENPRAGSLADVMIKRNEAVIIGNVRLYPDLEAVLSNLNQVDIRFYAAAPLTTPDGAVVGLLAVGDTRPHEDGTPAQFAALKDLADLTVELLMTNARRLAVERGRKLDRQRRDLALEAAGLGEFEWDLSADRMSFSSQMEALTGLSGKSVAGEGGTVTFRHIHADDREQLQIEIGAALRETGRYRVEYRIVRPVSGEVRWMMGSGATVLGEDGAIRKVIGVVQDITDRKREDEQREVLMAELDHRIKNVLSAVQSLAAQSARKSPSTEAFLEAFTGRLTAMAQAHELLTSTRWKGASLGKIVASELGGMARGQAVWAGPDLFLTPRAANAMSLALHELSTNAMKYGALSVEKGRILVEWRKKPDGGFALDWTETGGPKVVTPERRGFGSVLVERVTGRELGGTSRIAYEADGVRAHFVGEAAALAPVDVAPPEPPAETPPPVRTGVRGIEGLRLLIVEDATLLALELEAGLVEAGAEIVGAACDIKEALSLAELPMDAAVLDVNLGGSLVTPVAQRLAARGIPFVFATGYGERGAPGEFDAPVVRKPYNIQQIVRAVALVTGR
jgi:PAS domain S-box-containing protein